jgi:tRNA (cytidine/uridine-2'-O-)-methyltransferase
MIHVILVRPLIPWNTGAIGRTCLCFGARLHLIGPLGFSLEDSKLKRAGLDYWPHVDLKLYKDWEEFQQVALPALRNRHFLSKFGKQNLLTTKLAKKTDEDIALIFGNETQGVFALLGDEILKNESTVYIPMLNPHRKTDLPSFNLSTSVGMVLWEAWRQQQQLNDISNTIPNIHASLRMDNISHSNHDKIDHTTK